MRLNRCYSWKRLTLSYVLMNAKVCVLSAVVTLITLNVAVLNAWRITRQKNLNLIMHKSLLN